MLFWFATPEPVISHQVKIGWVTTILLLRSNLSSWHYEQNETRKPNHLVIAVFVDYKLLFSLEVSNPNLRRLDAVANSSVLSVIWVDFLWVCPTWSDIVSGCKGYWIRWGKCCVCICYMCFHIFIQIHWFG